MEVSAWHFQPRVIATAKKDKVKEKKHHTLQTTLADNAALLLIIKIFMHIISQKHGQEHFFLVTLLPCHG